MKLKEVIEKDYGIVVNNREEYDRLAKILDEAGLRWKDNQRYTHWHPCNTDLYKDEAFILRPKKGIWFNYIDGLRPFHVPLSDLEESQGETELERLRNRVKELEAQLSQQQPKDEWPKVGDEYWCCHIHGSTGVFKCGNDGFDLNLLSIGNVHRTKEAAEAWFERKQLEHKMNEGGKVQVFKLTNGDWDWVDDNLPSYGNFSSVESAQSFLSDPKNIELLNKHLR
jgi:hypothetical protein